MELERRRHTWRLELLCNVSKKKMESVKQFKVLLVHRGFDVELLKNVQIVDSNKADHTTLPTAATHTERPSSTNTKWQGPSS